VYSSRWLPVLRMKCTAKRSRSQRSGTSSKQRTLGAHTGFPSSSLIHSTPSAHLIKVSSPALRLGRAGLLFSVLAAAQSTTVNVEVNNRVDSSPGVNGRFQLLAMSTSFQLAGWDFNFFDQVTGATVALYGLAG
jgi:hypothetical protein